MDVSTKHRLTLSFVPTRTTKYSFRRGLHATGLQIPSKNVVETDKRTDNYGFRDVIFCTSIFMLGTGAIRLNLTLPTRELNQRGLRSTVMPRRQCRLLLMAPRVRINAAKSFHHCTNVSFFTVWFSGFPGILLHHTGRAATSVMHNLSSPCSTPLAHCSRGLQNSTVHSQIKAV